MILSIYEMKIKIVKKIPQKYKKPLKCLWLFNSDTIYPHKSPNKAMSELYYQVRIILPKVRIIQPRSELYNQGPNYTT